MEGWVFRESKSVKLKFKFKWNERWSSQLKPKLKLKKIVIRGWVFRQRVRVNYLLCFGHKHGSIVTVRRLCWAGVADCEMVHVAVTETRIVGVLRVEGVQRVVFSHGQCDELAQIDGSVAVVRQTVGAARCGTGHLVEDEVPQFHFVLSLVNR